MLVQLPRGSASGANAGSQASGHTGSRPGSDIISSPYLRMLQGGWACSFIHAAACSPVQQSLYTPTCTRHWGFSGGQARFSRCIMALTAVSRSRRRDNKIQTHPQNNHMDEGAWRATPRGVAKNQTRVSETHTQDNF